MAIFYRELQLQAELLPYALLPPTCPVCARYPGIINLAISRQTRCASSVVAQHLPSVLSQSAGKKFTIFI